MKTKTSILLIILLPILFLFLLGTFIFGLFALYKTINEPELTGLIVSLVFIWLSVGISSLLLGELRNYEIKNETLIIRKTLLGKTNIIELSKVKYKEYDRGKMYWIKMNGILLQFDQSRVIQLNRANFRNSKEFIAQIKESCMNDETLELKFNYRKLKVIIIVGIIIFTFLGFQKLIA